MALEELQSTVSKLTFNLFGSETERKIGGFLFNEKTEWTTSRELHGLAALTFNNESCTGAMDIISKALEPKDNTWRTLHKAVKLLHHFVVYGAERCVDHAWDRQRKVEALRRYNSAMHSRTGVLNGGGTDFGGPVRKAAEELDDLLKDSEGIRAARAQERDPGALLPLGDSDDYVAPVQAKPLDLGKDDAFGVVPQGSVGAKFDLEQVPGLYEGRPDRYFDNTRDSRKRTQGVEDSDHTRQALAPDLLDLDIGEAQPANVPDAQDLVRARKDAELQKQLLHQQKQLEQLKMLMLGGGGQASLPPPPQQAAAVGGGVGVRLGGTTGLGAAAAAPADKVMQAFGSMGLGALGGGGGGGGGNIGGMGQMMPNAAMTPQQQQGGIVVGKERMGGGSERVMMPGQGGSMVGAGGFGGSVGGIAGLGVEGAALLPPQQQQLQQQRQWQGVGVGGDRKSVV